MRTLKPLASCLGMLAATAIPSTAAAQSYNLQRFDPSPAGDRLFGQQSPSTQGHLELHGGVVFDYAYNAFTLSRRRGPTPRFAVVRDQAYVYGNVSLALWDRLTVGLLVPGVVLHGGDDSPLGDDVIEAPDGPAFGDMRLSVKGSFLGGLHDAFQLGVGGYFWAPTGKRNTFVGDAHVRGSVELLLGGEIDRFYWNFATGPEFRQSKALAQTQLGTMYAFAGGFGVNLGDEKQVQLGPEVKVSITPEDVQRRNTNGELLLGAKYRFLDDFVLGAAGGPGITEGYGTPDMRLATNFMYSPDPSRRADEDGDGVDDHMDACPGKAGVPTDDPETHGCPPPPPPVAPEPLADGDADGVPDDEDACKAVAGVATSDPKTNGCPADGDADGVPDDIDKCPSEALVDGKGDPSRPGCNRKDADGDGIVDSLDACPAIKGTAHEDSAQHGCPGDTDGDGVRDDEDACPDVKGEANEDPTKNGCLAAVRLKGKEIIILQKVEFATGQAKIQSVSDSLLDQVASVINNHGEIELVEVQGHTDNRGGKGVNKRLSQARAEAVVAALVKRGIEAKRLAAKGFGSEAPIADNGTEEGRSQNRRVEFKIVKRTDNKPKTQP